MMQLRWRDGVATVLVGALGVTYIALLANGSAGFIEGPRTMAAVGLLSALILCPLAGITTLDAWAMVISILGAVTLGFGIAAVAAESWPMLAVFMVAIAVMWALSTLHHALTSIASTSSRVGSAHA